MRQQFADGSDVCFDRASDVVRLYVCQTQSAAMQDLTARLIARRTQQELCAWLGIRRYEVDPLHLSFSGEHMRRRFSVALILPQHSDDVRVWQKYFEFHRVLSQVPRVYLREATAAATQLFPKYLPADCDLEDMAQALTDFIEQWEQPSRLQPLLH